MPSRLVDSVGMGKEYQVMGITNKLPGSEDKVVWPFFDGKRRIRAASTCSTDLFLISPILNLSVIGGSSIGMTIDIPFAKYANNFVSRKFLTGSKPSYGGLLEGISDVCGRRGERERELRCLRVS